MEIFNMFNRVNDLIDRISSNQLIDRINDNE